jgi:hypothetical protein
VRGINGGKFKRRLSKVNTRAVSRGQNELVCKFKMIWLVLSSYYL